MRTVTMSVKELRRLEVLGRVRAGELTLRKAAELMGVGYRQARRLRRRYEESGVSGLGHGLRGRAGNRRGDGGLRRRVVEAYASRYAGWGPTHAAEWLGREEGLSVSVTTLRRWLASEGLWRGRRKAVRHRRRRERRACVGELVQMDGSPHAWFGDRGPVCVLMVMIDDATSWTWAWFFKSETTEAAMTIFRDYVDRRGLPRALYPDRHGIYRVNTKGADEEENRTGKRPKTQFGRAMSELGVELICAHSPQAKGRVERRNSVFQDRLVKELALHGIDGIEGGNAYLEGTFLPDLNDRFTVAAAESSDVHVEPSKVLGAGRVLEDVLCVEEERVVGSDWCVRYEGRWLQLGAANRRRVGVGRKVTVRRKLDGTLGVSYRGRSLVWEELPGRPDAERRAPAAERLPERRRSRKPAA